jgi:hypothetical protein
MKTYLFLTVLLILNFNSLAANAQVQSNPAGQPIINETSVNQVQFGSSPYQSYYGNTGQNPVNFNGNVNISPNGTSYTLGFQWGFGGPAQSDNAKEQLRSQCVQKLMVGEKPPDLIVKACLEVNAPGYNQFKK